jgi:hypothetical protein
VSKQLTSYVNEQGIVSKVGAWSAPMSQQRVQRVARNLTSYPELRDAPTKSLDPQVDHADHGGLRWEKLNSAEKNLISRQMEQKHGITGQSVYKAAGAHLDAMLTRAKSFGFNSANLTGRDWYLNEGHELAGRAQAQGVSPTAAVNTAAIISPSMIWAQGESKPNADVALKLTHVGHPENNPIITVLPSHVEHILREAEANPGGENARALSRGDYNPHTWVGSKPASERTPQELATLGSFSGSNTEPFMTTEGKEKPSANFVANSFGANAPQIPELSFMSQAKSRGNVAKALTQLQTGKDPNVIMGKNSPKPRRFRSNLLSPYGDSRSQTIDRWEQRALFGKELGNSLPAITGVNKEPGVRPHMAELISKQGAYAFTEHHATRASQARGLVGSEGQSVRWLHVKGLEEGFGQFGMEKPEDRAAGIGVKGSTGALNFFNKVMGRKSR